MSDSSASSSDTAPGASRVSLTEVAIDEGFVHVALSGDLDVESARTVELAFTARTAARKRHVLVDVSQLKFISSFGIGVMVACAKACGLRKHKFVLIAPQPNILDAIQALRLTNLLIIEPNVESAMRTVSAAS